MSEREKATLEVVCERAQVVASGWRCSIQRRKRKMKKKKTMTVACDKWLVEFGREEGQCESSQVDSFFAAAAAAASSSERDARRGGLQVGDVIVFFFYFLIFNAGRIIIFFKGGGQPGYLVLRPQKAATSARLQWICPRWSRNCILPTAGTPLA